MNISLTLLNQTLLTLLLYVKQTYMTELFLLLIQKDSVIHMHGLTVYAEEGLHSAWDLSLENSTKRLL